MTLVHDALRKDSGPGTLRILRDFFGRVHEEGIRYCHWKSTEHLTATMTGATDVDVLFERQAAQRLTRLLTDTSTFKRFVVKPGHGYPGIEDYVGFDSDTGALTHLHIHYQLTLGEKFLKGHRPPWEELYLATRVLDESHGIYVADPNLELIVILVRAVMKLRARDFLLNAVGKPFFRGGLLREFRWLANRTERSRLLELGSQLIGPRAAALLPDILSAPYPSLGHLRKLRRLATPGLHEFRLYGAADAMRRMSAVEWSIVFWKIRHWYLGTPTRSNRTIPQGGVFVAILGPAGAGTSTLIREIARWLSREVAVTTARTGTDSEPVALPRRLWRRIRKLWHRTSGRRGGWTSEGSPAARCFSLVRRAVSRGMIVLSDRIPQRESPAGHEEAPLRLAELTVPNLVVNLRLSAEVARQRTGDAQTEKLAGGASIGLEDLPSSTRVVNVDADMPLPQVLLEVKRAIWDCI